MPLDLGFLDLALLIATLNAARYVLFAGAAAVAIALLVRRRWPTRRIASPSAGAADVRREVLCSLRTVAIFGVVGAAVLWAARDGHTRLYFDVADRGWAWFWISIPLVVLLHDTWFYWTHRAMHSRWLFRWHATHHRSVDPTPWTAYSFSSVEALVQAGIFPLAAFLLPIHPLAFGLFLMFQIAENVLGHQGYEVFPRWLSRTPWFLLTNTPTHHVMHHRVQRANFGLYFNVWDRLCGTNHPEYRLEFERVTGG